MHPQQGQSSIEYVSVIALLGTLLVLGAAVTGAPVANAVTRNIQRALCTVTGARCATLTPQPCTVRTTTLKGAVGVKFTLLKAGRDSAIIRSESSDGTISITLLDHVDAGVQAALGAKGKIQLGGRALGAGAMAQASLIAQLGGGRTWKVKSSGEADALVRKLELVIGGRVASSMPGGIGKVIDLGQRVLRKGAHAKLPATDSRTLTGKLAVDVKALLGPLAEGKAKVGALVGVQQDKDGSRTVLLKLDGTVARPLAKAAGTEGTGSGEVSLALKTDRHGGLTELTVGAGGALSRNTGLAKALAAGRGKGRSAAVSATLDLTDPADRARARALLDALGGMSQGRTAAAVADLAAAVADHAAVDVSTYRDKQDTYGFDVGAGVGAQAAVNAELSRNISTISGAWSRPPHGVWEARLDCRA